MSNKMLIDASHPEETRVVVVHGNKIEELDFESEHKKQLKGNIYLARITRIEPSLQAAFIEYGGNRHGFLTFAEIHPDYYQIPIADRLALLEEEKAAINENYKDAPIEETTSNKKSFKKNKSNNVIATNIENDVIADDVEEILDFSNNDIEMVGAEDVLEELPAYPRKQGRKYKIQEVIKRRQILLVQVIKEERGNKGAALTTYLSLAGRYSVLMPNTARGGGISRKIINIQDRKRLKDIVKELDVPKGMGVILRTAGANRTKAEIKRDYEYLIRLWDTIRTLTLKSTAPCLIHEESNLIKRSIRDLYNKNINEILVSGDQGYREAKDFMRMLIPSHAKVVQPYRNPTPIFTHNDIEIQLDKMLHPQVSLKSGGYLVINQTEALVAIDVNSGRSTKEHSVEKTALQTNLEAAEEVARQLRLRDLAGLIVIDFIDMLENRNIKLVEKKLKDCLKHDRARIQVGHISHFGLMEMSRQRIRVSVLESTTQPCPHCAGTGNIRSESSIALHVMRSIEEYLFHNSQYNIIVRTPVTIALYVLNHKRHILVNLETRFGLSINIEADDSVGTQHFTISKGSIAKEAPLSSTVIEDNDTKETENSILIKSKTVDNNKQRQHKNQQMESNNGSIFPATHKNDTPNAEDTLRRGRRRGRRGGRSNQSNNSQFRISYAEPVGDFAKKALEEIKAEHRQHYNVPAAETVGFSKDSYYKNDLSGIQKNKTREAYTAIKSKKRNVKTSEILQNKQVLTNDKNVTIPKPELVEKKLVTKSNRKTKIKEINEIANEVISTNTKKLALKIRKKIATKKSVQTTEMTEQEPVIEKIVEHISSSVVTTPTELVVTSSEVETNKKTERVGWWKRKGFFSKK